jgi:hypothetical protein
VPFRRRLVAHWLSLGLAAAVAAVAAAPAGTDPQVALEEAREAMAAGNRNAAVRYLEQAVVEDPKFAVAYRWLSELYADQGLLGKAVDAAATVVRLTPTPQDADRLLRLLRAGFPRSIARETPDAIPLPAERACIDPGPDTLPDALRAVELLFFAGGDHSAPAEDPKFGWRFDRAAYGYIFDAHTQQWQLRFTAHYAAASGIERARLAANCTELLLRAACVGEARLGVEAIRNRPLNIWLSNAGSAGAESWSDNIYLMNANAPREPAEWVRQILHEYGHAVLPGVDHFDQPEPWANGRLGEQLFARWLEQSRESNRGHPWLCGQPGARTGESPPPSARSLDTPLADSDRCVSIFLRAGPASELIDDRGQSGMDYYLGFANYVERAFGGGVLASAMRLTAGNTCRDFAVGVQTALARRAADGVMLRAVEDDQARARYWVYLAAGDWQAACDGCGDDVVTFNGRPLGARAREVGRVEAGWHSIALPAGATATFTATPAGGP